MPACLLCLCPAATTAPASSYLQGSGSLSAGGSSQVDKSGSRRRNAPRSSSAGGGAAAGWQDNDNGDDDEEEEEQLLGHKQRKAPRTGRAGSAPSAEDLAAAHSYSDGEQAAASRWHKGAHDSRAAAAAAAADGPTGFKHSSSSRSKTPKVGRMYHFVCVCVFAHMCASRKCGLLVPQGSLTPNTTYAL